MSKFLLLNFEDFGLTQDITKTIQSRALMCICCLAKDVSFINLTTCSHSRVLDKFLQNCDLKPMYQVVCMNCHRILKNVNMFYEQVETALKMLTDRTILDSVETHNTKLTNLSCHKIVDIHLPQALSELENAPDIDYKDIDEVDGDETDGDEIDGEETDGDEIDEVERTDTNEECRRLAIMKTSLDILQKNVDNLGFINKGIEVIKSMNFSTLSKPFGLDNNPKKEVEQERIDGEGVDVKEADMTIKTETVEYEACTSVKDELDSDNNAVDVTLSPKKEAVEGFDNTEADNPIKTTNEIDPYPIDIKDEFDVVTNAVEYTIRSNMEDAGTGANESGSDTRCQFESSAPGMSPNKKLGTEIALKKCVTKKTIQDFEPQSTDKRRRRSNKKPKSAAERGREFRARRALLKQQKEHTHESGVIVQISTQYTSTGPSERVLGLEVKPLGRKTGHVRTVEQDKRLKELRSKAALATRRWRERKKLLSERNKHGT